MCKVSRANLVILNSLRSLMNLLPFRGQGKLALFLSKIFLPDSKVCVPLRTGSNMIIDFRNKHEVAMYFDIFAKPLSKLLERLLRPGDIFVDCGANVGYFSFFAAPLVTKAGKIIAIDANPYCIQRMEESKAAGKHHNVQINGVAVGECSGQIRFNIANDPMYSSISNTGELAWTSTKESIDVKVEPLDKILGNVFATAHQTIRLLKLDVEGAEIRAIRGAGNLLKSGKIDYIYTELHPIQMKLIWHEVDEFHSIMGNYGYHLDKIEKGICIYSSPDVLHNPV